MARAFFLLALLAAATLAAENRFTISDSGRTVVLGKNDLILLDLEANPSTGFQWVAADGTSGVVPAAQPAFDPKCNAPGCPAIGHYTFRVEATGLLALEYKQPFDTHTPAERTFSLTIEVEVKPQTILVEADNGKAVAVGLGELFGVRLPEGAGTGFGWYRKDGEAGPVQVSSKFACDEETGKDGCSGSVLVIFKAESAGKLTLEYKQPWRQTIAKTFSVDVELRPRVVETESGKILTVKPDALVDVELATNPSTGFSWVRKEGQEATGPVLAAEKFSSDACPEGAAGCGGVVVFTFKAVAAGKITLEYKQPWTGGEGPVKTFELSLEFARGTRHFSELDDGFAVSLALGEEFEIDLEASPSSGYSWSRAASDVGGPLFGSSTNEMACEKSGCPAIQHMKFAATASGTVTLEYRRPWEFDAQPRKTFVLYVHAPFTVDQNGKTISVPKGSIVHIDLKANPSTGYNWFRKSDELGGPVWISHAFKSDCGADEIKPGCGGVSHMEFNAVESGPITLQSIQPWSPEEVGDTYTLNVVAVDAAP